MIEPHMESNRHSITMYINMEYNLQGSDGLWSESVHVGEVGGNNLGLFGALPTSDSTLIISHSFQVHDTPCTSCWYLYHAEYLVSLMKCFCLLLGVVSKLFSKIPDQHT